MQVADLCAVSYKGASSLGMNPSAPALLKVTVSWTPQCCWPLKNLKEKGITATVNMCIFSVFSLIHHSVPTPDCRLYNWFWWVLTTFTVLIRSNFPFVLVHSLCLNSVLNLQVWRFNQMQIECIRLIAWVLGLGCPFFFFSLCNCIRCFIHLLVFIWLIFFLDILCCCNYFLKKSTNCNFYGLIFYSESPPCRFFTVKEDMYFPV